MIQDASLSCVLEIRFIYLLTYELGQASLVSSELEANLANYNYYTLVTIF